MSAAVHTWRFLYSARLPSETFWQGNSHAPVGVRRSVARWRLQQPFLDPLDPFDRLDRDLALALDQLSRQRSGLTSATAC